jgi:diguanylate cyclase (GGDEF)-like protein
MLAAAPFVFVMGPVLDPTLNTASIAAVSVTCLGLLGGGAACWRRPQLMPDYFYLIAPFVATMLICGMNLVTHDASTGAQLFYLWPVLYSANFLSRRVIYFLLTFVLIGEALVVFTLLTPNKALGDWAAMTLAMTMTAVVVVPLRDRAEQLMRRLENQALADPLTGLANRRSFDAAMIDAGAWASRTGRPLALVTIDLDHFKTINDTWGHVVGDQALQAVAEAMRSVAEKEDITARLGGDEFIMLLRADRRGALRATEALRDAVRAITSLPGGPPGLSIGLAVMPDDATTTEALLEASDAALYKAKTRGRGQVAVAAVTRTPQPSRA